MFQTEYPHTPARRTRYWLAVLLVSAGLGLLDAFACACLKTGAGLVTIGFSLVAFRLLNEHVLRPRLR